VSRCAATVDPSPSKDAAWPRARRKERATPTRPALPRAAPAPPAPPPCCRRFAMAIHLCAHAFVANPLRGLSVSSAVSPSAATEALRSLRDPASARMPPVPTRTSPRSSLSVVAILSRSPRTHCRRMRRRPGASCGYRPRHGLERQGLPWGSSPSQARIGVGWLAGLGCDSEELGAELGRARGGVGVARVSSRRRQLRSITRVRSTINSKDSSTRHYMAEERSPAFSAVT
jgi:hypothetical protein